MRRSRFLPMIGTRSLVALLLSAVALYAGLVQTGLVGSSASGAEIGGTVMPSGEGALIEGVIGQPRYPYPLIAETGADRAIVALTYRALTRLDAGGWPQPDLATEWSVSSDGLSWTFALDPAARWEDGTPVSPEDVVLTIGMAGELGVDGGYWEAISATPGDDGSSIVITGPRQLANLPAALGGLPLLPDHHFSGLSGADLAAAAAAQPPHGTGPFALEGRSDAAAVLERRDDLLAGDRAAIAAASGSGAPVTAIGLLFYADAATAFAAWDAGSIDLLAGVDHADATAAASRRGRKVELGSTVFTGIATNLRPGGILRDPLIRSALASLLDPVGTVATYGGSVAVTPVSSLSWAWTEAKPPIATGDATAATLSLKRAKWSLVDGAWLLPTKRPAQIEILTLPALAFPVDAAIAQATARAWSDFGIATSVLEVSPEDLTLRLATGNFTAAVVNVDVGIDPDLYPLYGSGAVLTGGNIAGIQLRSLDALLNAARVPGTLEERRAAMAAVQEWCAKTVYTLPIRFGSLELLAADRVQGLAPLLAAQPESHLRAVLSFRLATP